MFIVCLTAPLLAVSVEQISERLLLVSWSDVLEASQLLIEFLQLLIRLVCISALIVMR